MDRWCITSFIPIVLFLLLYHRGSPYGVLKYIKEKKLQTLLLTGRNTSRWEKGKNKSDNIKFKWKEPNLTGAGQERI